jgi:hypothetical protein
VQADRELPADALGERFHVPQQPFPPGDQRHAGLQQRGRRRQVERRDGSFRGAKPGAGAVRKGDRLAIQAPTVVRDLVEGVSHPLVCGGQATEAVFELRPVPREALTGLAVPGAARQPGDEVAAERGGCRELTGAGPVASGKPPDGARVAPDPGRVAALQHRPLNQPEPLGEDLQGDEATNVDHLRTLASSVAK